MKNKDKGNTRACICIHTYVHACSSSTYTCFMHAYAYTSMRTHVRVPETMKDKEFFFFCIKDGFWNESTLFGSRSKPLFSHYTKPYIVAFQNTEKILRENTRFSRNSESKREFFHKKSLSQYFYNWGLFWLWSWSFKITNHFCIWLWIDLTEENGQNQAKELFFWGIKFFTSFLLFFFVLIFIFVYVAYFCIIICLLSLGFRYLLM